MSASPGREFADAGVEHVTTCAHNYCRNQEQFIQASNQPEIIVLQARASLLNNRLRGLREGLVDAVRAGRERKPWGSRAWNLSIAILLTISAVAFTLMTFDAFHLGWKPYIYSGGLSVVGLFALDYFMTQWPHPNVARTTSIVLLAVAIPTIVVLAVIRGDVFAHALNEDVPVVIGDAAEQALPPDNTAQHAALLLRWAMALAALGFEIAAGIAVHEFRKAQQQIDDDLVPVIRRNLEAAEMQMLVVIHRIAELESQPAAYRAMFWRDFYRGLLNAATSGGSVRNLVVLAVLMFASLQNLRAADNLDIVIPLDMSNSEIVRGHAGQSEFDQSVRAVSEVLATLPAGSRANLIGVTDDSLMTPYTLFSARLSDDPGPFSSRLIAARRGVSAAWTKRAQTLSPQFIRSDLLGAFVYAGQVFMGSPGASRKLVIFSDMRHQAHGLDLETPKTINVAGALEFVRKRDLFAGLSGVDVYVFGAGAHGGDKDAAYWTELREFWTEYFRRSGATLRWFSPGRESEVLIRVAVP
jgi:hypothetical protein